MYINASADWINNFQNKLSSLIKNIGSKKQLVLRLECSIRAQRQQLFIHSSCRHKVILGFIPETNNTNRYDVFIMLPIFRIIDSLCLIRSGTMLYLEYIAAQKDLFIIIYAPKEWSIS